MIRWLLALLALVASTGRADSRTQAAQGAAKAPSEQTTPSEPTLVRLAPTARELHAQRVAELERRIERSLSSLPEIADAHVQLTLPLEAEAELDRPLPKPSVALLVTLRASGPSDRDYANIVTSALSGREPTLTIVRRPLVAPRAEPLVTLGPFQVEARSAPALRAVLIVTLVTNALLALWVLKSVRSRSTRRTES